MFTHIPIMPLNAVLFPGMPMPLFIFEPRYRAMIERCQEESIPFGVALIREGQEVGGPAVPWEVGTTATIVHSHEGSDGGLNVLAIGTERFRLLRLDDQEPYLTGEVEVLPEPDSASAPAELYAELQELFSNHLRLVLQLMGHPEIELEMPETPVRLSYMVAAHLTCPPLARQRLLEMDDVAQRLFHEKHLLQKESEEYRLLLAARRKYDETGATQGDELFSLN
jgi:Lon protease-like protein